VGTFSHNSKVYLSFILMSEPTLCQLRKLWSGCSRHTMLRELWQVGETNMPPILFLIDQDVHGGMFLAN